MDHFPSLPERVAPFMQPLASSAGVVAVSGGVDSVALARTLVILHQGGLFTKLVVAHLNHQLRGAASDADEAFVLDLARQFAVTGRSHKIDVPAVVHREGGNLESVARRLRYQWLAQLAQEEGATWVATGHTADDQAETVLHRLLRGSGLHGLAGIPSRRELAPGILLLRPLLPITRAEILAFVRAENLSFREDASNHDLHFTRNRLRHELLPYLAQHFNPAISAVLGRLAEQAQAAQAIIQEEAWKLLGQAERPRAGNILIFDLKTLKMAPSHLVREMFRLVWRRENWPEGGMGFVEWHRLVGVVAGEETAWELPGGIQVRGVGRVVQLAKK